MARLRLPRTNSQVRYWSDLSRTALVLARFGPHLPDAMERALRGRDRPPVIVAAPRRGSAASWFVLGAGTAMAGMVLGLLLG